MKYFNLLILVGMLCGCASRYQITLNTGNVITTHGRPKLNADKTAFEYKDGAGIKTSIPVFRVKEIEPL